MAIEFKKDAAQNPFKEKILDDINKREDYAYQKVEEKRALYSSAMKRLNIFQEKKYYALSRLNSSSGANSQKAKCDYKALSQLTSGFEIDSDVLRGSLQSSLSYCSKMSQSAFVANSILG